MKRVLYFILLFAELFVGLMLMISLWDVLIYIPIAVGAVLAGLLIWQTVRYFKVSDPERKKKILTNIALAMLLPSAAFFVTYVVIAIMFVIAFV